MGTLVKLIRSCVLAIAAAALASCGGGDGGGDGGGGGPDHSPSISNLRYSPSSSLQAAGGNAAVEVLVDFADSGGDVVAARMSISSGADLTVALSNLGGVKNGTSTATFRVPLDTVGKYTFKVWLTDGQAAASNQLTGTFEVLARDTIDHPPSISNLRYSPQTAVQSSGGTASVVATVDFADTGADIVSLRLTTSAGADLTVPLSNLSGIKSGTATGTFIVAVDVVGKYTFQVWLLDSKGAASNRLSGGFEVLAPIPARDPPAISNLKYSPATAVQSAGGTASINVSVDFSDAGANVVSARFMSSAGPDLTVPVTSGSGIKSGTATATFVVSTTSLGAFTFQVSLVDSKGDSSNNLSGSFEVVPASGGSTWTKVSVSPPAELFGIGWDGQRYIAVGGRGTVITSPDLNAWVIQASGVTHTLRSVAVSPTGVVAVGDNTAGEAVAISSLDGANWSVTHRSTNCSGSACSSVSQLSRVIWTGTQYIAVGMERPTGSMMFYALVLTSPDGVTWSKRAAQTMPISDEWYGPSWRWVLSVAWSGSVFVLPAIDSAWEPVVWVSAGADVWTKYGISGDLVWSAALSDVVWGNGRFVGVQNVPAWGGNNAVVSSTDGVHWTSDTTSANLPVMNAITSKPSEFVAVGGTYRQTSPDGQSWTVFENPADCGNGILWDGSRYVSVGTSICKSQ